MMRMMKMPKLPSMSYPVKLTVVGASVGITLIAVLASYFRRRRRRPFRDITEETEIIAESVSVASAANTTERRFSRRGVGSVLRSPNGDISGHYRVGSPALSFRRQQSNSSLSINASEVSGATLTNSVVNDTASLTAEQLCDIGMEALHAAIEHWEHALEKLDLDVDVTDNTMDPAAEELSSQLHRLLERAYHIQDQFEQRLFRQISANVAVDSAVQAIQEMDRAYTDQQRRSRHSSLASLDESSTDQDSFVSATDMADLTDLEDQVEEFQHLVLYEAALLELKHGTVPFRTLRTQMVNCLTDTEFLAKLHCVRLALTDIFKDDSIRDFFALSGRQMIADLLIKSDRDPEDFQLAYDDMIDYVKQPENWAEMEEELRSRGVKMMTFYDVVIDFIFFDAFDDLENPPSSVTTVVQNRWLSNGFKETALSTAVWSVLKAKRRMLKFPKGFISHFYGISEHVSPVLAWGFLGPPGELKSLCYYFKDQVMAFMKDVFSFDKAHYTTIELLADDIVRLARDRIAIASARLAS